MSPEGNGGARAGALSATFAALNRLGVEWCVLHGHDRLPEHVDSDVDMAVAGGSGEVLRALTTALAPEDLQLAGVFEEPGTGRYAVFATKVSGSWEYLHLDFHDRCRFDGITVLEAGEALKGRYRVEQMWISSPAVELVYSVSKRLLGRGPASSDVERWRRLIRLDPTGCSREVQRIFGKAHGHFADAIEAGDLDRLCELREALLKGPIAGSRKRVAATSRLTRWVDRMASPNGLLVAIVAEDRSVVQQVGERIEAALARYPGHRAPEVRGASLVRRFDVTLRGPSLRLQVRCWMLCRRSRIVLLQIAAEGGEASWAGEREAPLSPFPQALGKADLSIALELSGSEGILSRNDGCILIRAGSIEEGAAAATDEVLAALAARARRRVKIKPPGPSGSEGQEMA